MTNLDGLQTQDNTFHINLVTARYSLLGFVLAGFHLMSDLLLSVSISLFLSLENYQKCLNVNVAF